MDNEDFESSPEYQTLAVAAMGKPERVMGESVIPAEPPQWSEVRRLAIDLLKAAPKQLSVHIYLIRAEAHVNGFRGLHAALQSMTQALQDHWEDLYPQPDLDDPDDMYYERVNLVNELSEQPAFLDTVYRLPLVSVRGIGDFSARDMDISTGVLSGSAEDQARCQEGLIRGAFAESDKSLLQEMAQVLDSLPILCRSVETVFAEKSAQPGVLSMDGLISKVEACGIHFHHHADAFLELEQVAQDADKDSAEAVDPGFPTAGSKPATINTTPQGTLRDRAMVREVFQKVMFYYQTNEPSSPVRVLLYRASTFVDMSFFEALQALAPEHRDNLPALLQHLKKQPLASFFMDSYARHCDGETVPLLTDTEDGAGSQSESDNEILSDASSSSQSTDLRLNSPMQVIAALQEIELYYANNEPASPIPLILADIRQFVPKRFTELISDLGRLLAVDEVPE